MQVKRSCDQKSIVNRGRIRRTFSLSEASALDSALPLADSASAASWFSWSDIVSLRSQGLSLQWVRSCQETIEAIKGDAAACCAGKGEYGCRIEYVVVERSGGICMTV